jgi:hypothetical protein
MLIGLGLALAIMAFIDPCHLFSWLCIAPSFVLGRNSGIIMDIFLGDYSVDSLCIL